MPIEDEEEFRRADTVGKLYQMMSQIVRVNDAVNRLELANKHVLEQIESTQDRYSREQRQLRDDIKREYILREEFDPVRRLVYGFVSFVLIAVLGAFLTLLLRTPPSLHP